MVDKATRNKSISRQLKILTETAHTAYKSPSVSADDDVFLMFKSLLRSSHGIKDSAAEVVNMKQNVFMHASQIQH